MLPDPCGREAWLARVAGSACDGMSNSSLWCAGRGTTVEVLAFFGVFGLLWAGIQASAVEHAQLRALNWTPEVSPSHWQKRTKDSLADPAL